MHPDSIWPKNWCLQLLLASSLIFTALQSDGRDLPKVSARAWLLMDQDSGYILSKHNEHLPLHPGGLTKLMTGFVLFRKFKNENLDFESSVSVGDKLQSINGPRIFLQPGEKVKIKNLLAAMFAHSANDATLVLVNQFGKSKKEFVGQMNRQARVLGLTRTRFKNVTGLPDVQQASTAADLGLLSQALSNQFPQHQDFFKTKKIRHHGIDYFNRNALLWRDPSVTGLIASHNQHTGHHLIATSNNEKLNLIVVVLDAKNEQRLFEGAQALLDYGRHTYETTLLYPARKILAEIPVDQGNFSDVPVGMQDNLYVTLPKATIGQLQAKLEIEPKLIAPVQRGQDVGNLTLVYKDKVIAEHPLVALESIVVGNELQKAWGKIQNWIQGDTGIKPTTQE